MRSTVVLAAALTFCGAACGESTAEVAPPDAAPGCLVDPLPVGVLTGQRVILGDVARTYTVSVPDGQIPGSPVPIVLVFHGDQSSGTEVRALLAFETVAGQPTLFVYPDAGATGWDLASTGEASEDLTLIAAILDDLDARACFDRTRVFASGFGTGAAFVNHLACERGDLLRGIAPISGSGPDGPDDRRDGAGQLECPTDAPPAFVVHGNADLTFPNPIDGSAGGRQSYRHWAYWGRGGGSYDFATEDVPPAPCVRALGLPDEHEVYGCFVDGLAHAPWPTAAGSIRAFFASRR